MHGLRVLIAALALAACADGSGGLGGESGCRQQVIVRNQTTVPLNFLRYAGGFDRVPWRNLLASAPLNPGEQRLVQAPGSDDYAIRVMRADGMRMELTRRDLCRVGRIIVHPGGIDAV